MTERPDAGATPPESARAVDAVAARLLPVFVPEIGRGFLWLPVWVSIGILAYFALPGEPSLASSLPMAGWLVSLAIVHRRFRALLLVPSFMALGFAAAVIEARLTDTRMLETPLWSDSITGRLLDIDRAGDGVRLVLGDLRIDGLDMEAGPSTARMWVSRPDLDVAIGDEVVGPGRLMPASAPLVPGGFDFRRHAFYAGTGAYGFFTASPSISAGDDYPPGSVEMLRQSIGERIAAVMGRNDRAALATALLTGERGALSGSVTEAMRVSGLGHLLAISGLHLGLVAGFVFFTLRAVMAASPRLALTVPIKKIAAAGAIVAAFGYLILVGSPTPTQRAFIMTALVLTAVIADRQAISLRLIALAGMAVLFIAPHAVTGPSFQMSFAAVLALVAGYEALNRRLGDLRLGDRGRLWRFLTFLLLSSCIASAATMPFAAYHFQRIALIAPVANLLAVPLTAMVIMPAGLIALLVMPIGLEDLPLLVMEQGIAVLLDWAYLTAGWPHASLLTGAVGEGPILLWSLGFVALCLLRGPARLPVFAACACLSAVILLRQPSPDILVAERETLAAARGPDGEIWLTSPGDGFVRAFWMRWWGRDGVARVMPRAGYGGGGDAQCDAGGCVTHLEGRIIAFPRSPHALIEDCRRADLVIAQERWRPVDGCTARLVTASDLREHGTLAVFLFDGAMVLDWSRPHGPGRPWHPGHSGHSS